MKYTDIIHHSTIPQPTIYDTRRVSPENGAVLKIRCFRCAQWVTPSGCEEHLKKCRHCIPLGLLIQDPEHKCDGYYRIIADEPVEMKWSDCDGKAHRLKTTNLILARDFGIKALRSLDTAKAGKLTITTEENRFIYTPAQGGYYIHHKMYGKVGASFRLVNEVDNHAEFVEYHILGIFRNLGLGEEAKGKK